MSGDRPGSNQFWKTVRASQQGPVQTAFRVARNLARRLRSRPCG